MKTKNLFSKLSVLWVVFLLSFVSPLAGAQIDNDLDEDLEEVITLADLPQPFLDSNLVFNEDTVIVVGDYAAASDTLGAVRLAGSLNNLARMSVDNVEDEDGDGEEIVIQGVKEEIELGGYLNDTFGVMSDNDLGFLQDTSIKYGGDKIDIEESIEFLGEAIIVYSEEDDADLEDKIGLELDTNSIVYKLTFEDELRMDEDEDSIDLKWLNQDIEIVDIDADEVTIRTSTKYSLDVGDVTTVNGKKITLVNVGTGSVVIEVDGEVEIIEDGQTQEVNGIEITVVSVFYEQNKEERMAFFYIGEKVTTTLEDDDCAELAGEINGDTDCTWVYTIKTTIDVTDPLNPYYFFNESDFMGIAFDQNMNDFEEYILEGDSIAIPGINGKDFAVIKLLGTNEPTYLTIDIEEEGVGIYELKGNDDEAFVFGSDEYKKVYLDMSVNLFYEEYDLTGQIGDTNTQLVLDDSELTIDTSLVINTPNPLDLMNITPARDEIVKTQYGIDIIGSEEWMIEFDELTIRVPEEQLLVEVIVGREGSGVDSDGSYIPANIEVQTKLASEVVGYGNYQLILIGGPCSGIDKGIVYETLIWSIFDLDCEDWNLDSGQALVKMSEDGHILIAGTDAIDTRAASVKVANSFEDNLLTGTFEILEV